MEKLETEILKILEEDCRYSPAKIALMLERPEKEISDVFGKKKGSPEKERKKGV